MLLRANSPGRLVADRRTRAPHPLLNEPLEQRVLFSAVVLDPTFGGGDGIATAVFAAKGGLATCDAAQPDGKAVATGGVVITGLPDDTDLAIARFNADGSLDRSFGGDGMVVDSRMDVGKVLQLLPGGKIFVSGVQVNTGAPIPSDVAMLRYNPDGTPDATFGNNGLLTVDFPQFEGILLPHLLPDGRMLLIGSARLGGQGDSRLVFARLQPDGTIDRTFGGGDGFILPDFGGPSGFDLLPDGRFVLSGTTGAYDRSDFIIGRFLPDGSPDPTFGGPDRDGKVSVDVGDFDTAFGLSHAPDGGYTLVGTVFHSATNQSDYALAHVTADGALDPAFGGGDGVAVLDGDAEDTVTGVATLADGRILISGIRNRPDHPIGLARVLPDGTFDRTFGDNGFARVGSGMTLPLGLAVQGDGKVLVAGGATTGSGGPEEGVFAVARVADSQPPPPGNTYQAEQASVTGAIVSRGHAGFTGSGFVDYQNATGDAVAFTVQAPSAGWYDLSFRYTNGGTSDRAMALSVNGQAVAGGVAFARTGAWTTWRGAVATVQLAAGANTIRLAASGQSGPNLDSLNLRPSQPPDGGAYQAESAVLSGATVASNHAGYTGSGFADYRHASGDYVEFPVEVVSAGNYLLEFRYANGGTAPRSMELRVDGQVMNHSPGFVPTGGWGTWKTAIRGVTLSAGRHTVRLTAKGQSGPNLDSLTVRLTTPADQTRFDPAAEFSTSQNPSGPWSYGYSDTLAGPLTLYDRAEEVDGAVRWASSSVGIDPNVGFNPSDHDAHTAGSVTLRPGDLAFHPGPDGQWSHFVFRAPTAGSYAVSGSFGGLDTVGTTTDVRVRVAGSDAFAGAVNGTRGTVVPFSIPARPLKAGDTIDFAVGFGSDGTYYYDSTLLNAVITREA
jgi:uncharacterized delta-60 repeat protein